MTERVNQEDLAWLHCMRWRYTHKRSIGISTYQLFSIELIMIQFFGDFFIYRSSEWRLSRDSPPEDINTFFIFEEFYDKKLDIEI